ncbi:hypothetical protein IAG41_03290 [Sphingomonas sp. JC676]|uniref:hypothetical protein n=1 Tax=Sphingomonas sp. JC676 TaxID=2768065 RepID=UPI0016584583|nr:hypothetical protein [Sphingomonas sp. JC676]MBC9031408.1 hypothetical protein [Sphingomonas sp. JC676]
MTDKDEIASLKSKVVVLEANMAQLQRQVNDIARKTGSPEMQLRKPAVRSMLTE